MEWKRPRFLGHESWTALFGTQTHEDFRFEITEDKSRAVELIPGWYAASWRQAYKLTKAADIAHRDACGGRVMIGTLYSDEWRMEHDIFTGQRRPPPHNFPLPVNNPPTYRPL